MYGQLKSTVQCLECQNESITFDPFLTLSLPIQKPTMFKVAYVPYDIWEVSVDSEESDDDYKTTGNFVVRQKHIIFSFDVDNHTQVKDLKNQVLEQVN